MVIAVSIYCSANELLWLNLQKYLTSLSLSFICYSVPILVCTQVLSKGLLLTMTIINECVSRLPSTSCHFRACLLHCRLWEAVFVFMFCLIQCQAIHSVQQTIKVGEILLTVTLLQIWSLLTPYRKEKTSILHMYCYMSICTCAKQKTIRFQNEESIY